MPVYLYQMVVDYLVIGQGICGTMLTWFLHKEGKTFMVIDNGKENASSRIAAGIINPVTGRRYAYTWMIDELMPFALLTYEELGKYFNTNFVFKKSIIDFFPSAQMRNAFVDRINENDTFLHPYPDQNNFNNHFNYEFGCGEVSPAYIVSVQLLLKAWREKINELHSFGSDTFECDALKIETHGVSYKGIVAEKIIFCDGSAAINNPWFSLLPFAPNKGEALIIESKDIPHHHIFKKGLVLAPMSEEGIYWVGSNYQWSFENEEPSESFYNYANKVLKSWIKHPFSIISHVAGIRPATLERRPFAGFHPLNSNIGILNGMGTKGTSLAPFFANEMVQHLVYNFPISPEADVHRFSRILSK